MDRNRQLSNVAFGGAWSEQIAGREALADAIDTLRRAAGRADMVDPRKDAHVSAALDLATACHPKGAMLHAAWLRAAGQASSGERVVALREVADKLALAIRGRLGVADRNVGNG